MKNSFLKLERKDDKTLRLSAKKAPHCFACGLENPNGDLLCLAHSNALKDGRGASYKSMDRHGAIMCHRCHDIADGRTGSFSKEAKREFHRKAHVKTLAWWIENGYLKG